jgi:hypothetical protein
MSPPRPAYELSQSQVKTPESVVSLFWKVARKFRKHLPSVLDMGAGDCRFAIGGAFDKYVGIELDKHRVKDAKPPANGKIIHGCVFRHGPVGYDACIGNPPYARHHDIEASWKKRIAARLERELCVSLNQHCNLYLYFFWMALLKSHDKGLVALVIPYEWVSRPSAKALRGYVKKHRWNVAVYRFQMPIFDGVLTTASFSIVDKACRDGEWKYYDITPEYRILPRHGVTDSNEVVLDYARRGKIWALRGLSPGTQKVFTLSEGGRVRAGLSKRDVVPCVTSLRYAPYGLRVLSEKTFQKHYVESGKKCWLIRSNESEPSAALRAYLDDVPEKDRQTYTCESQTPWYKYLTHPVPQMLLGSGFMKFGPKVLLNSVGARAVGSVLGVHAKEKLPLRNLQGYLLNIDFEKQVVAHANTLKKIEVKQLNSVLNAFDRRERMNGRKVSR